mmetsp:Transcript_45606/g.132147  ORF Transcript_45606/g.132147 Transcript_45606/m.132147 type:complete len:210 (-) Transcript_45606:8-637(-)
MFSCSCTRHRSCSRFNVPWGSLRTALTGSGGAEPRIARHSVRRRGGNGCRRLRNKQRRSAPLPDFLFRGLESSRVSTWLPFSASRINSGEMWNGSRRLTFFIQWQQSHPPPARVRVIWSWSNWSTERFASLKYHSNCRLSAMRRSLRSSLGGAAALPPEVATSLAVANTNAMVPERHRLQNAAKASGSKLPQGVAQADRAEKLAMARVS